MTDNEKNSVSKLSYGDKFLIFVPNEGNYIEILGHRIDGFESFEAFCEHLKKYAELEETVKIQKAEIERLTKLLDDKCDRCIAKERAEVVKEFAERLKEKFACLEYVIQTNRKTLPIERVKAEVDAVLQNGCSNVVDKILKEMVGEG